MSDESIWEQPIAAVVQGCARREGGRAGSAEPGSAARVPAPAPQHPAPEPPKLGGVPADCGVGRLLADGSGAASDRFGPAPGWFPRSHFSRLPSCSSCTGSPGAATPHMPSPPRPHSVCSKSPGPDPRLGFMGVGQRCLICAKELNIHAVQGQRCSCRYMVSVTPNSLLERKRFRGTWVQFASVF